MNAIILAGGKSSRMGTDKAFLKIKGQPLIKRQLSQLKKIFKQIIIVTDNPKKYKKKFAAIKIIQDIIPNRGPLGGIYSGLLVSDSFHNFVFACDMPFINLRLIRFMSGQKRGYDVVVPRLKKGYETLFAIYSKNCISHIYKILNTDNIRIRRLFDKVRLKEIRENQIKRFGDPQDLFMNINTKDDLCRIFTSPAK